MIDVTLADNSTIIETARVVAVAADSEASVWLETMQQNACHSCVSKKTCGKTLLPSLYKGQRSWLKLPSRHLDTRLQVNDIVELMIPGQIVVWGSFLVYLMPLCMMILGAITGQLSAGQTVGESVVMFGAAVGLGLGFLIVRWHGYRHRYNSTIQPRLLHRVGAPLHFSG